MDQQAKNALSLAFKRISIQLENKADKLTGYGKEVLLGMSYEYRAYSQELEESEVKEIPQKFLV